MWACAALEVRLRIPLGDSLKAKRSVIRPIIEGARRRYGVSAAEVADHDVTDRATVVFASVGAGPSAVTDTLDAVDRFVWSFPDVEVVEAERYWVDTA